MDEYCGRPKNGATIFRGASKQPYAQNPFKFDFYFCYCRAYSKETVQIWLSQLLSNSHRDTDNPNSFSCGHGLPVCSNPYVKIILTSRQKGDRQASISLITFML